MDLERLNPNCIYLILAEKVYMETLRNVLYLWNIIRISESYMNSILGKLSSYQILINIIPGAFFVWMLKFLFDLTLPLENIVESILLYYFVGLIVNRIGSLVVAPILKETRLIKYKPHSEFIMAEKIDPKIRELSDSNDCFSSFLTCALLLPVTYGLVRLVHICGWLFAHWEWIAVPFLILLFFFSHKKQTDYICNRIDEAKIKNENHNQA